MKYVSLMKIVLFFSFDTKAVPTVEIFCLRKRKEGTIVTAHYQPFTDSSVSA